MLKMCHLWCGRVQLPVLLGRGGHGGRAVASSILLLMILASITVEKCSAIGWMAGLPTVTERGSHTRKEAS